ncbi:MAG: FecR family protein, partial [Sphingomonadaceae bacterium]|nr:FecR family protein [Sphingomonadaceae bacterium]
SATAAIAAPKVIGITAALVNDVRIKPAAISSYKKAKLRQRIALADRVRTGQRSRMQMILLDKSKFSVGANAELTIDRFVYDPNGGSVSASLAKGAMRFMSGSSRKAKKTVNTPSATIGIRGTIFDTAVGQMAVNIAKRERAIPQDTRHDPLTATLVVLRGPGPNRPSELAVGLVDVSAAGETATLDAPLLAAYVPYRGATPIGPFPISLPGVALLSDFIVPPPLRDYRPFDPNDLPFADDTPRGPPPHMGRPGYEPGNDSPDITPGMGGIPGIGGIPGMTGGFPGGNLPHRGPDRPAREPSGEPHHPEPGPETNDRPPLNIDSAPTGNGPAQMDNPPNPEPAGTMNDPGSDNPNYNHNYDGNR